MKNFKEMTAEEKLFHISMLNKEYQAEHETDESPFELGDAAEKIVTKGSFVKPSRKISHAGLSKKGTGPGAQTFAVPIEPSVSYTPAGSIDKLVGRLARLRENRQFVYKVFNTRANSYLASGHRDCWNKYPGFILSGNSRARAAGELEVHRFDLVLSERYNSDRVRIN